MFEQIIQMIDSAHPVIFFLLLMAAGCGLAVSEDTLVVYIGAMLGRGDNPFPLWHYIIFLYAGAIVSDMITFQIGKFANKGFGKKLIDKLMKNPETYNKMVSKVQKHGDKIGFVQRISPGARFGMALISGFTGIDGKKFFFGACLGGFIMLPIQLGVGYIFKDQIKEVIEFMGNYIGPAVLVILAIAIFVFIRKSKTNKG